jgi:hypothetical protein
LAGLFLERKKALDCLLDFAVLRVRTLVTARDCIEVAIAYFCKLVCFWKDFIDFGSEVLLCFENATVRHFVASAESEGAEMV